VRSMKVERVRRGGPSEVERFWVVGTAYLSFVLEPSPVGPGVNFRKDGGPLLLHCANYYVRL